MNRPSKFALCLLFQAIILAAPLAAQVIISEIDAINIGSATDLDGNDRDWIELVNTGGDPVSLDGWALSDELATPGKWVFPNVTINPGAAMLVFASGKDWKVPGIELHTNFKLNAESGIVLLSQPDGSGGWTTAHSIPGYPEQHPGLSYGYAASAAEGALGYFQNPTPGALNGDSVVNAFVADTDFDHARGYYDTPFDLVITCATAGAAISYTLDGSEPTLYHGTQVFATSDLESPVAIIPIETTSIVRAAAFKEGLGNTNIDTHTFIFAEDVLEQDSTDVPLGYASWGHSGPDWEMDPRVTGHSNPEDRCVPGDFMNIPTVSVVARWEQLFGNDGIYIEGEGVRIPASFEIINPEGDDENPDVSPAEHGRGTVLVFGGSSTSKRWKTDKLSFRFNFDRDMDSVVLGEGAVGTYDRLVLDARLNNVWTQSQNFEQRQFGDYTRDALLTDLEQEIGVKSVHSQHVHLFINGLYWGLYTLHERPDKHFTAAYFGGDKDDWDVVKHGPGHDNFLVDGARINPAQEISNYNYTAGVNYLAMIQLAMEDLSIQSNYDALAGMLDIPALVDHILVNFYGGNYDWPQHNWYASRNRADPEGKWRFHSWDAEHVFKYVDYPRYDNVTNKFEGWDKPDGIHLQLLENPEYRFLFADTAHKYLYNDGAFSVERVWSLFERRFDDIDEAIRAESARWGDSGQQGDFSRKELHLRYSNIETSNAPDPRQSDTSDYASWYHERERIRTKLLGAAPNRATRFIEQMQNAVYHEDHPKGEQPNPLYPQTDAPVFSQHGGAIPEQGYSLAMTNPNGSGSGVLYYTTDGSDPREPFTGDGSFFSGDVASTAMEYTGPVFLNATTHVKSRILLNGEWSALNEAVFLWDPLGSVPATAINLMITEIHYHPMDPTTAEISAGFGDDDLFEYFEVMNTGTQVVSLEGLQVQEGLDIAVFDSDSRFLAPGARAVFVADPEAFAYRYGPASGSAVAGQFMGGSSLSNGGERLHLLAANGSTISDFEYDDEAPWPLEPDGDGFSLVLIQPGSRDPSDGWNWRASLVAGGTPGDIESLPDQAAWTEANFSPDDPGYPDSSLPGSDPDGDGLTNLEERFFGTDPWSITPDSLMPEITVETLNLGYGPETHAVMTFTYMKATEDIEFTPQSFTGLNVGNRSDLLLLDVPVDNGDGTETRQYYSPASLDEDHDQWFSIYLELF